MNTILPPEIIREILEYVSSHSGNYATVARHVCQIWRDLCPNEDREPIINLAMKTFRNRRLIEWIVAAGYRYHADNPGYVDRYGACSGHAVLILQHHFERHNFAQTIPYSALINAAQVGNLRILQMAIATGQFIPSRQMSCEAIARGQYHIVEELLKRDYPLGYGMRAFAAGRSIHAVEYIDQIADTTDRLFKYDGIGHALSSGNFHIAAKMLRDDRYEMPTSNFDRLLQYCDAQIVNLHGHRCKALPPPAEMAHYASRNPIGGALWRDCHILNDTLFANSEFANLAIDRCCRARNVSALTYIYENIRGLHVIDWSCVFAGGMSIVEWWQNIDGGELCITTAEQLSRAVDSGDLCAIKLAIAAYSGQPTDLTCAILAHRKVPLQIIAKNDDGDLIAIPREISPNKHIAILEYCCGVNFATWESALFAAAKHSIGILSRVCDKCPEFAAKNAKELCAISLTRSARDVADWVVRKFGREGTKLSPSQISRVLCSHNSMPHAAVLKYGDWNPAIVAKIATQRGFMSIIEYLYEFHRNAVRPSLWKSAANWTNYPRNAHLDLLDWALFRGIKVPETLATGCRNAGIREIIEAWQIDRERRDELRLN